MCRICGLVLLGGRLRGSGEFFVPFSFFSRWTEMPIVGFFEPIY
jgi:hypothetical protein